MKDWWKYLLRMALPLVRGAGAEFRNKDSNDTGKDDLIGYSLTYLADLGEAILSDDASKIQAQLNKTSPIK